MGPSMAWSPLLLVYSITITSPSLVSTKMMRTSDVKGLGEIIIVLSQEGSN
jgi:hypothetical protein